MNRGSIAWSEEETKYLKALLSFDPSKAEEVKNKKAVVEKERPPVGEFRILVIGAKGCGKTSILTRAAHGTFAGENQPQDPKYERGCRWKLKIEDQLYVVDALELPSQQLSSDVYIKQAVNITEGAVLVYDVESRDSLDAAQGLYGLIQDAVGGSREYGLYLVGNKCDAKEREVSWLEGHKTATGFKVRCAFLETSAKSGDNVDKIFPQLGREILKLKWLLQQRREQAQRLSAVVQGSIAPPVTRKPRWKSWVRPWFHRRVGSRKTVA